MGKARRLRKTSRVVRKEESGTVSKSRPVAKTKRVLHKEALKQKRGRGLSKPEFPIWLTQKDKQELVQPKTKLGLASLVDSLDSLKPIEGTKFSIPTTPTVVSPNRRNNMAAEALQLTAIVEDDRYQSHPFEALQKHLKVTVAGSSSSSLKLKQEEAAGSLSAAPYSGHCHRKTKRKHHGKLGKLRKPSKNT